MFSKNHLLLYSKLGARLSAVAQYTSRCWKEKEMNDACGEMNTGRENSKKTYLCAILSTTNRTWPDTESNSARQKPQFTKYTRQEHKQQNFLLKSLAFPRWISTGATLAWRSSVNLTKNGTEYGRQQQSRIAAPAVGTQRFEARCLSKIYFKIQSLPHRKQATYASCEIHTHTHIVWGRFLDADSNVHVITTVA
jgi:hypothetical protein